MNDATKAVVALIARNFVGWLAGGLVTLGLVQSTDKTMFITIGVGICTGVADYGWSWWQNKGHAKLEAAADYWKEKALAAKQQPQAAQGSTPAQQAAAQGAKP